MEANNTKNQLNKALVLWKKYKIDKLNKGREKTQINEIRDEREPLQQINQWNIKKNNSLCLTIKTHIPLNQKI